MSPAVQPAAYDILVFIGRFQPPHSGHFGVIRAALQQCPYLVVVCGSAGQPRSLRNPWTADERAAMIAEAVAPAERPRLRVVAVADITYSDVLWVREVQAAVADAAAELRGEGAGQPAVALIGAADDRLDHYAALFPQWGTVLLGAGRGPRGTEIRAALFAASGCEAVPTGLPPTVARRLRRFCATAYGAALRADREQLQAFRDSWRAAPYPPVFVTVDAVVLQGGHVLLVERGHWPGRGLLALPGGFVDQQETLLDACLRELHEETRLGVPAATLRASVRAARVFDAPFRSARGRTITHAFLIELPPHRPLPAVEGGDDARRAQWLPLAGVRRETLFEDHYCILQALLSSAA